VFHALLIQRQKVTAEDNPLRDMLAALDRGDSLIIFPEGTRSSNPEPQRFKSGLFHLAKDRPTVEFVPVYLENLNRILPKGEILPVPLLGSVTIGAPIRLEAEETKEAFLERARQAVWNLHHS
jgi:1-acyl-sn-glycerol-3-phosphate acyltransferase